MFQDVSGPAVNDRVHLRSEVPRRSPRRREHQARPADAAGVGAHGGGTGAYFKVDPPLAGGAARKLARQAEKAAKKAAKGAATSQDWGSPFPSKIVQKIVQPLVIPR